MKKTIITLILLFQLTGCKHTITAMRDIAPQKYYSLTGYDDLPQTLTDRNVTFSCKNLIYSSMGYTKKCYVQKTTINNIGDWARNLSFLGLFAVGEMVHMGVKEAINKKDPKPQQTQSPPPTNKPKPQ